MRKKTYKVNGYDINIVKTDKFRQVMVSVFFGKNNLEGVVARDLLSNILLEGSKEYPNQKLIKQKREENYNQTISSDFSNRGKNSLVDFTTTFIHEKYVEKGHQQRCLDFFLQFLLKPKENFDEKDFLVVQKKEILDFEEELENPDSYANLQARIKAGFTSYYQKENLRLMRKIKKEDLYEEYLEMINNDILDITIVGDVDDEIIDYFKIKFPKRKRKKYATFFQVPPLKKQEIIEPKEFSQSKLVKVYKLLSSEIPRKYPQIELFDTIFGGTSSSRLFQSIREKESLAYDVRSYYYYDYNCVIVKLGLAAKNYKKAVKIINREHDLLKKGQISEDELKAAKKRLINNTNCRDDNVNTIINDLFKEKYYDMHSYRKEIEIIKKTTVSDLVEIANQLQLDTTYLLKGATNEKAN